MSQIKNNDIKYQINNKTREFKLHKSRYDWFVGNEMVANKTGDWYFGVVVLNNPDHPSVLSGSCSGLSKSDLSDSFGFKSYDLRIFTGGEAG